ncbi:thioesterase domain-containing protein [Kibdelosporangium banguiense]|uniref:Thioesterase domain-containing protein n=1 Tax=Kibdelosporangium banguiense TaxID=1365924 RepID=A0ABS4TXD3_9PSEU|nr:alpha/beta fold hydrolase [Kibdelosporangium banguiense]MBP2329031.1 thioesterase domain-containing protein [Kibdelosporangium banguiense]
MSGSHPSTVEEKRRALLQLRLRRKREEIVAQREERSREEQATVSPLVPLRPEGARPPLFLVHAVGGSVAPYVGLAGLLGDDQPVYALEDPGLNGGAVQARGLPAIATAYLAAVRDVQPDGPLHLGGWSGGGAIALEMARQDGDVAVVLVIDTAFPAEPVHPDDDELRTWFAADMAGMGAELGEAEWAKRFPVFAANVRTFLGHRPSPVDARVVLLSTEDSEAEYLDRWRAHADAIHVVPGNHYTMFQPPHIESLAEVLRDRLSEVNVR